MDAVRIASLVPVSCATRAFRTHGRIGITVVVKATYQLAPDAAMTRVKPDPLSADDLVPIRRRADVLFVGRAHAAEGRAVPAMPVRFAVLSGDRSVFDKKLIVSGDRVQTATDPTPAATPFTDMPIAWERALGGEGFDQNLVGIGVSPTVEGHLPQPNVFYQDAAWRHRPACFAPIDADAPMRTRFLAEGHEELLASDVPDLSAGVHDAYFQAASPDQQVAFLQGDETVVLEGLSSSHPVLRSHLSGERAVAKAFLPPNAEAPIEMQADSLLVDGDRGVATVTWRGCLTAADEAMLGELLVVTSMETEDRPVKWPQPDSVSRLVAMIAQVAPDAGTTETVGLSDTQHDRASSAQAIPFAGGGKGPAAKRSPSTPVPGAPWSPGGDKPPPAAPDLRGTIQLASSTPDESPPSVIAMGASGIEVGMPPSAAGAQLDSAPEPPDAQDEAPSDPWAKGEPWAKGAAPGPIKPPAQKSPKPPTKPSARNMLYGKGKK